MTNNIPEQTTVRLPNLQPSTLRSRQDAGIRALPHDKIAQKRLGASFTAWFAREAGTR